MEKEKSVIDRIFDDVEDCEIIKPLEKYPEQLIYVHQGCIGDGLKMHETLATFTKQEFLDSIKERKETLGTQKVLKRKGEWFYDRG